MCDEVGEPRIQETEATVTINIPTPWTGKVGPNGEKGCSGAARFVALTLPLDAPLGERELLGCRHDDQPCESLWQS
jgi:hypothetical protein